MGLSPHRAQSSIRFSLGLNNTETEIERVVGVLPGVVEKLRKLSGASRGGARVEAGA